MKLDPKALAAPLVAILVLGVTLHQTVSALKSSGVWQVRPKAARVKADDPYARIDRILAHPMLEFSRDRYRDPFGFGSGSAPAPLATHPNPAPPGATPAAPQPVLTSIIWDSDPRATIHFDNRDFSVRENSLFADFRVKSITSTEVVLERDGEALVLTLHSKGE